MILLSDWEDIIKEKKDRLRRILTGYAQTVGAVRQRHSNVFK
jgi:hypothetical protein